MKQAMKYQIAGNLSRRVGSSRTLALVSAVASCVLLGGCESDTSDLAVWMQQARDSAPRQVRNVPEPKRFEPFRFEVSAEAEPFSYAKMQSAMSKMAERDRSGLKPDLNRRREPLEAYALDAIQMVGQMRRPSTGPVALLQVDKTVYQSKVGNYIGQNFGRITQISETEVKIKELVQDAAGDWVERDTTLNLQEGGRK